MSRPPFHERAYRALLRLLPSAFRHEFGRSMTEDFSEQHNDARTAGTVRRLWTASIAGILSLAAREHLAAIGRDARHAVRLFRRRPAFTLTTILTLTVGIGVTTAAFSLVQAVILQQIPGPHTDRLVRIFEVTPAPELEAGPVSNANFVDWRREVRTLDGLALYYGESGIMRVDDRPAIHLAGLEVSDDFLRISGVSARLGRLFVPEDFAVWHKAYETSADSTPAPPVMLLQERAWVCDFGSDPSIVGRTVQFNDQPVRIVGVVADHPLWNTFATINGPGAIDVWTPGGAWPGIRRRARMQSAIGRLAPGVTLPTAQAEFSTIADALATQYPDANAGWQVRVSPLRHVIAAGVRTQLWLLFGVSMCVVLIGSLNVLRLLATLNEERRHEYLTRLAIGASRSVLARQAITESLLLSAVGGSLGVLLAYLLLPAIVAMAPADLPRLSEIRIHPQTLVVAAAISTAIGLFCGLATRGLSRTDMTTSRYARQSLGWWRSAMLVMQVAVALVLAVATGLLVRSMQHVESQSLGFVPENVLAATMAVPRSVSARDVTTMVAASNRVITALEQHPNVIAAAAGTRPLAPGPGNVIRSVNPPGEDLRVHISDISPNYFSVIGATTLEGRTFGPEDHAGAPPVIVLNARAAAALGFHDAAVGRLVELDRVNRTVIGVVADVRQNLEGETPPAAYVPTTQSRTTWSGQLLIRTAGPASPIIRELTELVGRQSEGITLYRFQTMDERILQLTASRRFILRLVTTFAVLAIVLAVVGIAGVMAESVAQRVREIGIRMALGARPQSIVRLFVTRGVRVVVAGAAIGLVVSYQFRSTLDAYVYGVPATDVWSYTLAGTLLVLAGMVACYLPARRAARIDPSTALR